MKAYEYIDLVHARAAWIGRMESALHPTTRSSRPPCRSSAPPLADVATGEERDAEFFRVNALLLRNPRS